MLQVMLYQEHYPEFDDEWPTVNEQVTYFRKSRKRIVGRIQGPDQKYFQGIQCSEEDLVVRDRAPSMNERPSVSEHVTNGKNSPVGQAHNNGYSEQQYILILMNNGRHESNVDKSVKYKSGEYLERNVHVRRYEHINKYPQRYDQ